MFSVVIPTFNRGDLLLRALDSVSAQSYSDYEVVVVDDGSTDGTREHLAVWGDRIRYYPQANAGPGAARNLGIRQARGEYIAFLDSDDLWFPWSLETFAELINRHSRPSIVGAELIEFRDEADLRAIAPGAIRADVYSDYFSSFAAGHYVGSGMSVIRRDRLVEAGGFTEDRANAEDHDLIFRLGTAAGFVKVLAPVTLAWRRHGASETGDVRSTANGVLRLVRNEQEGKYPGAESRRRQRQTILTSHARPASLGCLRQGVVGDAWRVYLATLGWHLRQGRWRYVAAFPALSLAAALRPIVSTKPI